MSGPLGGDFFLTHTVVCVFSCTVLFVSISWSLCLNSVNYRLLLHCDCRLHATKCCLCGKYIVPVEVC